MQSVVVVVVVVCFLSFLRGGGGGGGGELQNGAMGAIPYAECQGNQHVELG